ncbi:hypothetical protein [Gordonia sp. NPDC058843]|uniref:hypothetical protein n=1 Tax=Gordonia sp. NPDC058843 TaxID=3346648 RepID=UPI0036B56A98
MGSGTAEKGGRRSKTPISACSGVARFAIQHVMRQDSKPMSGTERATHEIAWQSRLVGRCDHIDQNKPIHDPQLNRAMSDVLLDPENPLAVANLEAEILKRDLYEDDAYEELIFVLSLYEMGGSTPYAGIAKVREEVRKLLD